MLLNREAAGVFILYKHFF